MRNLQGIPASPGYAVGPVHPACAEPLVPPSRAIAAADEVAAESERFRQAVAAGPGGDRRF